MPLENAGAGAGAAALASAACDARAIMLGNCQMTATPAAVTATRRCASTRAARTAPNGDATRAEKAGPR